MGTVSIAPPRVQMDDGTVGICAPTPARRLAYTLDGPAVHRGVDRYLDALATADVAGQCVAAERLGSLGLTLIIRHDLAAAVML